MPSQTPNAKEIPVNVTGSSTFGRYSKISGEKTFNQFESDGWLVPTGGFKKILEMIEKGGKGRGFFKSTRGNFMIAVINANVYKISAPTAYPILFGNPLSLNYSLIGSLMTQFGPVFIDENLFSQICFVDGLNAYIYNYQYPNAGIQVQTQGALGSGALYPNYVTFHNGLFLFGNNPYELNVNNNISGSFWYAYEYVNPTGANAIQQHAQLSLQTKPDYALAIKRIPGQANNVLVFGSTVCEVWTSVNTTDVYRKNTSVSVDYGCLSVDTIAASDDYIAWLGINEYSGPVILVYSGQGAQQISTDGISYLMSTIVNPSKSAATFLQEDGHLFYQVTFYDPRDNLTLRYDFTTKKFYNVTDENMNYFPSADIVYFNGENYFISLNDGSLYQLSTDFTTYDYNFVSEENIDFTDWRYIHTIPRIRIAETIRSPRTSRFRINTFTLTIEQGTDNGIQFPKDFTILVAEDGTRLVSEGGIQLIPEDATRAALFANDTIFDRQPCVDLAYSFDGCVTFGMANRRYLNPIGYRKNILQWYQAGQANEATPMLRFNNMGRVLVRDAVMDVY